MHHQRTACASPQSRADGASMEYLTGEVIGAKPKDNPCDDDDDPAAALEGTRNSRAVGSAWLCGGAKSAALTDVFQWGMRKLRGPSRGGAGPRKTLWYIK